MASSTSPSTSAAVTAPGAKSTSVFAGIVAWSPVWIAFLVLGQVALLGLRPALTERKRLAAAEAEMRARTEREQTRAAELERLERAQNDPIYLERERRALRNMKAEESDEATGDEER